MERLELSMTELATAIDQERATMQDRLEDYRHQASHQISRLNDVRPMGKRKPQKAVSLRIYRFHLYSVLRVSLAVF